MLLSQTFNLSGDDNNLSLLSAYALKVSVFTAVASCQAKFVGFGSLQIIICEPNTIALLLCFLSHVPQFHKGITCP